MPDTPPNLPPAGWYPDSENPDQKKWWDGTQWTEHVQDSVGRGSSLSVVPVAAQPSGTEVNPAGYTTTVTTDHFHPVFVSVNQAAKKSNGFGVAALVLGIIAMAGSAIPFVNYTTGPIAFIGLALGIVGVVLKGRPKAAAIAGTIIAGLALLLSIILASAYTAGFNAVAKSVHDDTVKAAKSISLVYTVTGDSTDSNVTYSTYTGGTSGSEQATNASLPFTKTYTVKQGGTFDFNSFSVFASNGQTGTSITCSITLDGKIVSTHTATGPYASADCSYTK
jgi:hypothetical protein